MLMGVDVGGTNLRLGVVDGIRVIDEQRINADFSGVCRNNSPDAALAAVHAMLTQALSGMLQERPDIKAIGLGFPGFIVDGRVAQSPNLPGLLNVDLASSLSKTLGRPVIIENDALAAAYGEYHLTGKQGAGLIYLGLGTGVGGGLIVDGRAFPGEHGVAMEVGHMIVDAGGRPCGCGNRGCMEQYSSASGVSTSYAETTGKQLTAHEIALLAETGDLDALSAYQTAGDKLAQALAQVLKVIDVGHVVIGGGMSAAWSLLEPGFTQRLDRDLIPALRGRIQVAVSHAGDQAGMIGAALLAETTV